MDGYLPQEISCVYHSSHLHVLQLIPSDHGQPQTRCCELRTNPAINEEERQKPVYGCSPCNFYIHKSCAELPPYLRHPSHASHTLSLVTISAYLQGNATCDACWKQIDGFSYHCTHCSFDLHTRCAFLAPTINRPSSHPHLLSLRFSSGFSICHCDICGGNIVARAWFYYCQPCNFTVHTDCIQFRGQASPTGAAPDRPMDGPPNAAAAGPVPNPPSSPPAPAIWPGQVGARWLMDRQQEPTAGIQLINPLNYNMASNIWPAQAGAPGSVSSGLSSIHNQAAQSAHDCHQNIFSQLRRAQGNQHNQGEGVVHGNGLGDSNHADVLKQINEVAASVAAIQVDAARARLSLV